MITPIRRQVLPFIALVLLLASVTLICDYFLHRFDLGWVGRYVGIPGTVMIAGSFVYSLRKRKFITRGRPKSLLTFHEFCAWFGSLLVLVHAGIHFNALLPWLATVAMGVTVVSGMVGKLLLDRSRSQLQTQQEASEQQPQTGQAMFWDSVMLGVMAKWRRVHIPIFVAFLVLASGHIISILFFWSWA
ncbi:MAG: hypothetical protein ACOYM2_04735 [Rectinemataceae bacterium]